MLNFKKEIKENKRMHKAIQNKKIIIYAICLLFFLVAGFFQMMDDKLPEFWHALFALLAHVILISLVIAWGVSLLHRMVRKDLRAYFFIVALLILFFLVIRMIKYGLTKNTETLNRYMWYSYYVSQCLIPPTLLLTSLSIENKKEKSLKKLRWLIFLPAFILLALIYTNDLHEWAFALYFNQGDFSYSHRFVFYVALVWEIIITIISIVIMVWKCRVSACKKKTWIPICTFFCCAFFSTICFIMNSSAFKIPELLCFTCIATIESCIAIGLIPSNENYVDYFYQLMCYAIITDEKMNIVYASKSSFLVEKEDLKKAISDPITINNHMRLCGKKIHGGYVFRSEDLTHINEINIALQETNDRLMEENDLIEVENEMKAQKAQIDEQKKLYTKVERVIKEELIRLSKLLLEIKKNHYDYRKKMELACVLGAYIKRRSNFIMLSNDNDLLDVEELAFSIKESLSYVALMGVECSLDFNMKGKMDGLTLGRLYDFFEICVANEYDLPSAIMVHVSKKEGKAIILIESDRASESIIKEIKERYPTCSIVANDGETTYFTLTLLEGGIL